MSEIRFFDANAVIGTACHPGASLAATPEELSRDMAEFRLEKALAYHTESMNDPALGNRLLTEQLAGYDCFVPCAVLAPAASGEFGDISEYFRSLAEAGFKAIRLFPNVHCYQLRPYVLHSVLEQAARWQMPVFIDCLDRNFSAVSTWDFMPDYDGLYALAKAWPQLTFILVLPGMTSQRQQYAILEACENVCLETSGYSYRFIEHVCKTFSASRLIAGSYMPRVHPGPSMLGVLYANISPEEKQLIAAGNLEQLTARAGKEVL